MSLEELLERVAVPRAGGSEALRGVGAFIEELLRTHSPEVSIQPFVGTPYGIGILMGVSLALALTFATAVWFDRYGLALGAVLAVALLGLLEMELLLPAVSWPARAPETNIVATFPGEPGGSTLVFAAHYDTATQFGDHFSWSLWGSLTLAAQGLALVLAAIGVFRRRTGNGLPRVQEKWSPN